MSRELRRAARIPADAINTSARQSAANSRRDRGILVRLATGRVLARVAIRLVAFFLDIRSPLLRPIESGAVRILGSFETFSALSRLQVQSTGFSRFLVLARETARLMALLRTPYSALHTPHSIL